MQLHGNLKMTESELIASEFLVEGSDKTRYKCELCDVSFSGKGNLNKHLRKFHQLQFMVQGNQTCALCGEKFLTLAILLDHLQNQHSITPKFIEETFYSDKDFLDWKSKIENESMSYYIIRDTKREINGISNAFYKCHRSGNYKVRGVKASGSVKIGSTCPSYMKVCTQTVDGISEIKVQYQSVHLGHDLGTCSLRLKKEERENLAACLRLGIPMDRILEEAKQNTSPTNRYNLLTRKHLHNIRRDFGIPLYKENPKPKKPRAPQNIDIEANDSSIGYEDYVEVEVCYQEKMQEDENSTAVSSILSTQNQDYSEELNNRKIQIVNQLRELQSRIEGWNLESPLPDIEENIKAINARLDISATFNVQGTPSTCTLAPTNKPTIKRRKITKTKKNSDKTQN